MIIFFNCQETVKTNLMAFQLGVDSPPSWFDECADEVSFQGDKIYFSNGSECTAGDFILKADRAGQKMFACAAHTFFNLFKIGKGV